MANHKEAFALMWYFCGECHHRERFWNSRDGVTPFIIDCPSCGGELLHVHWNQDEASPGHKLRKWQRYFRDGTPDEAAAIVRRRIERMRDTHPLTPEQEAALIAGTRDGSTGEFRPGWPNIAVHQ